MKKALLLSWTFVLISLSLMAGNERPIYTSILKEATVYRNGAELLHSVKLTLNQGTNEVVIDGISNKVDINSIQLGTDGKASILSMEFSTDYLTPVVKSALYKRLEDSVEFLSKELAKVQVQLKTDRELQELLKANKQIGGSQTGLSVAELIKMMDYYKAKSLELENEISQLKEKETKLMDTYGKLTRQMHEEETKNTKSGGKLVLQLSCPQAGAYTFTVSYLTPSAYWVPAYDLKVENVSKPLQVIYKAKMVQTTGIDWKNVKLSLATATPGQQGNAPLFQSWFLGYVDPVTRMESNMYMNAVPSMLAGRVAGVDIKEVDGDTGSSAAIKIRGMKSLSADNAPLYVINGVVSTAKEFSVLDPKSIQTMEVLKDASATSVYGSRGANGVIVITLKGGLEDYVSINDKELNVTFDIDMPYDVPSNGKEQQVELKTFSVPSIYKYYAAPKLDKETYLLAEVADWENLNLLPGEATIMVEGTYVGKTFIDPASTQDTLNLTLGKDKRVVVKREKLKDFSSVKFRGASKKQVFTYELTVKNNKKETVQMVLKEQYPLSTLKEIEVELLESSEAVNNTELGVLTWKLELPAGATKKVRVSYSVKYPKDKTLNLY